MRNLLFAVVFAASPGFAAQTLEFRFSKGEQTFVQNQTVQEGDQANFMGDVASKDGSARRKVILNTVLSPADKGVYHLQFQCEISSSMDTLQAQSAVALAPGAGLTVAQCGGWTVKVAMAGGKAAAPAGNYLLTAESGTSKCAGTVEAGSQMNVVAGTTTGGRKKGTVLNAVLNDSGQGTFDAQVQYESPSGLQAQNQAALTLGQKQVVAKGAAGSLTLRLDPAR